MTIKKFRDVDFINRDIECEFFLNYFKNKPERVLWAYGPKSTGRITLIEYILENRLNSKEYNIKLGKYLSPKFYFRYYYKQTQYYNEQQQFEIQYQTNKHLFLEGLYDEYKEDYRFGLQYSISF